MYTISYSSNNRIKVLIDSTPTCYFNKNTPIEKGIYVGQMLCKNDRFIFINSTHIKSYFTWLLAPRE